VILSRIVAGREDMKGWVIESRNAPAALTDPSQSFIVATGHFSREAMAAVYLRSTVPQKLGVVVAPIDRHSLRPRALRIRLQLGEMTNAIRVLREGDVDVGDVGEPGFALHMIRSLIAPGYAVAISTDVPWHKPTHGGLDRPFAGLAKQHFALGTARLARLSQRPIVPCVPYLDGDKRVIIEWGDVISPPAKRDAEGDARVTDLVLDFLERGVGRRPDQYVLDIGHDRSWDPSADRWSSSAERH
jgi:lauroyl/myristoyl acyltransferase